MRLLLYLCAAILVVTADRRSYEGYKIYDVEVKGQHHADMLQQLERDGHLDIVRMLRGEKTAEVWIGPESRAFSSFNTFGLKSSLSTKPDNLNIPQRMAEDFKRLDARYAEDPYAFDFNDFNTRTAHMAQLDKWITMCQGVSGIDCSLTTLGNSYLGNPIKMISIKKTGTSNPKVYLEHTIHAREWLSPTTIAKFTQHIIADYTTSSEVQSILNKYELRIIPIANPDGYDYTWTGDRYWRKNRAPNSGSSCMGTDLNRNFNAHWSKQGTSYNPCAQTFHGKSAGSEPETKVISNHVAAQSNIKAYFAVHCCYDVWMFPYGYNQNYSPFYPCAKTTNHDNLLAAGNAAIRAINKGWKTGTICDVIYAATGDTANYAYDIAGVKYTYAIELHGSFYASRSQIQPAYDDFWKGFMATMNKINELS